MDWLLQIFNPANITTFAAQFQAEMQQPAFWVAVGKIIWINVLLSGDNALVIALACRGLVARQRLWGMILGAGVAVVLRIVFTGIVATLMALPYLKLVGGLALIVIAATTVVSGAAQLFARHCVEQPGVMWPTTQRWPCYSRPAQRDNPWTAPGTQLDVSGRAGLVAGSCELPCRPEVLRCR